MIDKNNYQLFKYKHYKSYLINALGDNKSRTGLRKKASEFVGCQTAYLSKVLNGDAHLNLEQSILMSEFLGHDSTENDFFILLVQKDRAGSKKLKSYYESKIQMQIEQYLNLKNRLKLEEELPVEVHAKYYSKWYYSCIHVLVSIFSLRTKQSLQSYLNLPMPVIIEALEFLQSTNLIMIANDHYVIGPRHIHLLKDSVHINKHHANWRLRALESLNTPKPNDFHYSLVATLSQDDFIKIKEFIIELVQKNMDIVKVSKEECAFGFCIDYFQI